MAVANKRVVWVINHHAVIPSKDGRAGRHLGLASYLDDLGWQTCLLVASTSHPSGAQRLAGFHKFFRTTKETGATVRWVRATSYRRFPALRLVGMVVFTMLALSPRATRGLPPPDVVVGSTVHPLAAWAGLRLARRHKVPFIYEIRDIWPETLVDMGKLKPRGMLDRTLRRFSRHLAHRAALVVSPLPHVDQYLLDLAVDDTPFAWVPNGVDATDDHAPAADTHDHGGGGVGRLSFMYLGSHGRANALDLVIDAFDLAVSLAPDERSGWRLRLIGEGPQKAQLKEYARSLPTCSSISFEAQIPREEVVRKASEGDFLVVAMKDYPVYRYGMSLNKIFDYMTSGRPVILAARLPSDPISAASAGIVEAGGSSEKMAEAFVKASRTSRDDRVEMGMRGREHVRTHYSYAKLANDLAAAMDRLVEERP